MQQTDAECAQCAQKITTAVFCPHCKRPFHMDCTDENNTCPQCHEPCLRDFLPAPDVRHQHQLDENQREWYKRSAPLLVVGLLGLGYLLLSDAIDPQIWVAGCVVIVAVILARQAAHRP